LKAAVSLIILFTASLCFGYEIVMLGWGMDSAVERGFRDGVINRLPETRFYTYGSGQDMSLFKKQLQSSRRFNADLYFTNGIVSTRELLSEGMSDKFVFVAITYPFEEELLQGLDFGSSAGIKTNIPIKRLLLAMKKLVDYKKLGVLKMGDTKNYTYSIKEINKLKDELSTEVSVIDADDLKNLHRQLETEKPDAVYIPAHGDVDSRIFEIIHQHNIPTIAEDTEDVRHRGALLALVVDGYRAGRLAANKAVDILLKGSTEEPSIRSIEHFMFVVNLETASRLDVQIPMQYLIIADQIVR